MPVGCVPELSVLAAYHRIVLHGRIDDHPGPHKIRIAVEVAAGEIQQPGPAFLMHQGGMQADDASAVLIPLLDRVALRLAQNLVQMSLGA